VHLRVSLDPEGAASSNVTVPESFAAATPHGGGLPTPFYSALGGLVLTLLVAFLVLPPPACCSQVTRTPGSRAGSPRTSRAARGASGAARRAIGWPPSPGSSA